MKPYFKILASIAAGGLLLAIMSMSFADCKTTIWKEYHQYQTKGQKHIISFKIKQRSSTTVWLHCASGKPDKKLLLKVSDNARCYLRSSPAPHSAGLFCKYKQGEKKPCIKVQLECI